MFFNINSYIYFLKFKYNIIIQYKYFNNILFILLHIKKVIFYFLQHNIEKLDNRGRTPLMLAVTLGHIESVGVLLQHEANVNTENTQGWTGINHIILFDKISN